MRVLHLTGFPLIGSRWTEPIGTAEPTFTATDPATGLSLDTAFLEATPAHAARALREAQAAFGAAASNPERAVDPRLQTVALLEAMAEEIEALGETLLERARRETALPPARLLGERGRTVGQLRLFAAQVRDGAWVDAVIETGDPSRQPLPKPDLRRVLRPIGPVVVFGASNFPFAFGVAGGDTASALAAGNPVVVKGHPLHPGTNELMAAAVLAAMQRTHHPDGWFSLLQGTTPALSMALVEHPAAEAVGFTGSGRVGRLLFDAAARRPRPIPVYAEMGSLNPTVLLPGALAARGTVIASELAASVTQGVGQFCTKPGLVLLLESPGFNPANWLSGFRAALEAIAPGVLLSGAMRDRFCELSSRAAAVPGVDASGPPPPDGPLTAARLLVTDATTFGARTELREEMFGPATVVVRCTHLDELVSALDAVGGSLVGALHAGVSDDPSTVSRVASELEARVGRLVWNGYPTGVEVSPAMVHGGPYPATTASLTTSVGTLAIRRFARPVCYQNAPPSLLPPALQDGNPLGIVRQLDGVPGHR